MFGAPLIVHFYCQIVESGAFVVTDEFNFQYAPPNDPVVYLDLKGVVSKNERKERK